MKRIENEYWVYYLDLEKAKKLDNHKTGKWMYFFSDVSFADRITKEAVEKGIVAEAKHSNAPDGVCCFYLHGDDMEGHRKIISFMLENKLIQKTKSGRLYNMSFKFDEQTRAGEYGDEFKSEIKLANFMDLNTGEFLPKGGRL